MVDREEGQFYSMEGIAAAVLMVITAYLVLGTTSVYTPGDTHIIDMQLEQLGNDALKMMDTKNTVHGDSPLEIYIWHDEKEDFSNDLNATLNPNSLEMNRIQFKADIYYRNATSGNVSVIPFIESSCLADPPNCRPFTGNENAVRVSRWVFVKNDTKLLGLDDRNQTVLLEVLLWRG